ncbi:hypothetical protein KP509_36G002900 [Ceratopteris richardii]|uniref:Tubulin delta chain n=1 Tax=Ceratopteris richardii TaxID=49495 RepID=A0A8T2QAM3_CERRI|nr:hypothetical protein KP509_36G002900 [Ceratopteris richardii]
MRDCVRARVRERERMGVVVLQVGQGGNQFGLSLFDALFSLTSSLANEFFREPRRSADLPRARAVLIDSEPKVVAAVKRRSRAMGYWRYGPYSSYTEDSGSGNNWAKGFCRLGPSWQDALSDLVRREVEMCDIFDGFITSQSLAGGTGAGIGSYLLEVLKDEYPSCNTLSHCIWPLEGECTVQYYNVVLSIAHLCDVVDGLLLVKNETLMSTCKKALGIQRPSFDDMNTVGARALASVLVPAYYQTKPKLTGLLKSSGKATTCKVKSSDCQSQMMSSTQVRILSDLVTGLCSHPKYRMLALRNTPQVPTGLDNSTTHPWKSHLKQLKQMLYMEPSWAMESTSSVHGHKCTSDYSAFRKIDRCVANLLVLRGKGSSDADVSLLEDKALYPVWSKDPLMVATNTAPLGDFHIFASLLSNCSSAIAPAAHALSRARAMHASKAYLYQYAKHGLSMDDFDTSFEAIEAVLEQYREL